MSVGTTDVDAVAKVLAAKYDGKLLAVWKHAIKGFWIELTPAQAARLTSDARIVSVSADAELETSGSVVQTTGPGITAPPKVVDQNGKFPDDPLWHLTYLGNRLRAPRSDATQSEKDEFYKYRAINDGSWGSGPAERVRVYVIDLGVWEDHPELQDAHLAKGLNASQNPEPDRSPKPNVPADPLIKDPATFTSLLPCGDAMGPPPSNHHGTAVASMVVGKTVGVAKGAELYSISSSNCGGSSTIAVLLSALDHVVDYHQTHKRPAVLSMSTYRAVESSSPITLPAVTSPDVNLVEDAVTAILDAGIPVIVSANNQDASACLGTPARMSRRSGRKDHHHPARPTRVIAVGGVDANLHATDPPSEEKRWVNPGDPDNLGSNFGQCVDIYAPASHIPIAFGSRDKGKLGFHGTSYSAPMVAGLVARLFAADSSLRDLAESDPSSVPDKVWEMLAANASPFKPINDVGPADAIRAYLGNAIFVQQLPAEKHVAAGSPVQLDVSVKETSVTFEWYQGPAGDTRVPAPASTCPPATIPGTSRYCFQATSNTSYWVRARRTDSTIVAAQEYYADSIATAVMVDSCVLPNVTFVKQPHQATDAWLIDQTPADESTPEVVLKATVGPVSSTMRYAWYQRQPSNEVVPNSTGTLTPSSGNMPIQHVPIGAVDGAVYQLRLCDGSQCDPNADCAIASDTVQVRLCPEARGGTAILRTTEPKIDLGDSTGNRIRWYRGPVGATADSEFVPLRIDLGPEDGDFNDGLPWVTFTKSPLNVVLKGTYRARVSTACSDAWSSSVTVDTGNIKPYFSLDGRDPIQDLWLSAQLINLRTIPVVPTFTYLLEVKTATMGGFPPAHITEFQWQRVTELGTGELVTEILPGTTNSRVTDPIGTTNKTVVYEARGLDARSDTWSGWTKFTLKPSECPLELTRKLNGLPVAPSLDESTPFAVPYGTKHTIAAIPKTAGNGNLTYVWKDGLGATLSINRELDTGSIIAPRTFIVTVTDPALKCSRSASWKFTDVIKDPASCPRALNLTMSGICDTSSAPVVHATENRILFLTPVIRENGTVLPRESAANDPTEYALSNFYYHWRTRPAGTSAWVDMPQTGLGLASAPVQYTVTREAVDLELTVTTPDGCQYSMTIAVRPNLSLPACVPSEITQCRFSCRRHAVRVLSEASGGGTEYMQVFTAGDTLVMGAPLQAPGNYQYSWYRLVNSSQTLIGTAEEVTTVLNVPAEYWVVTRNVTTGEIEESEHLIAVLDGDSSPYVTVTPPSSTVTAGQTVHFTATFSGANTETQYEWRSGTRYDRLSAPIIGRSRTLTLSDVQDNAMYWCRVVQPNSDGSISNYNSPFVTLVVNCTNSVHGIVVARPQRLARNQSPMLLPAGNGKLLTYEWTRVFPDPSPVFISNKMNPKPVVTAPVTTFHAVATDVCGQSGDFGFVSVYLCIPTITEQPTSVLAEPGRATTLTVAATPAVDGQPLTVRWYRATDTTRTTPLHTGTTFTPVVTPGTEESFYAAIESSCNGSPNYVMSEIASVEVCAIPVITTGWTNYTTYPGIPVTISIFDGAADDTFQWYYGVKGDTSAPVYGETDASLRRGPQTTTRYWCRATSRGLCTSDSETITIEVCSPPNFTTHPQGRVVFPNTTVTLMALATSPTHPVQYQWQVANASGDWVNIANATLPTFVTPPAVATAQYRVKAQAAHCSAVSEPATVSLCSYPQTVTLPADVNIAYEGTATIQFPLLYPLNEPKSIRWYRGAAGDRTNLVRSATSATSLDYTTTALTATTQYWVEFEHNGCLTTSNATTVRVCKPTITTQPVGRTISNGSSAPLGVTTTSIAGQTFQWYTGTPGTTTNPVAGATTASINVSPTTTTSYWVRVKGTCTPEVVADSAAATVIVCNAPVVSTMNLPRSIRSGQQAAVGVNATGSNLTYQWYIGASGTTTSPISGATSSMYYVTPASTTSYWCRVTSEGLCQTNSETMTVDVCNLPVITQQATAVPARVFPGSTSTLSVTATSSGTLTYQWYTGASGNTASPIAGATARTLNVNPTVETSYWVRITTSVCTVDSTAVTVSICTYAPTVTLPAYRDIASGESVTLQFPTVYPLNEQKSIRWYRGAAGDRTNLVRSATSAATLDYTTPALTATTQYWVEFEHNGCLTISTATTVRVCKPTITGSPQSATILAGNSHTLTVAATGSPLTYQWYIGSSGVTTQPVAGATSPSLTLTPAATTSYWVRATGCGISADSAEATVTVCTAPAVTSLTKTSNHTINSTGSLTVTATGINLTYQWYKGQSGDTTAPIAGATLDTYYFTLQTSQYYWVRVTSGCNNMSVNSAALLYSVDAKVLAYPASVTIPRGTSTTLSVSATGTYLTYQWYLSNGVPIAGATSSTYTTPVLTANASYRVNVGSGSLSGTNGPTATVTVCDGPTIVSLATTYNYGSTYRLTVTVHSSAIGLVDYFWYSGVPGDLSQSISLGESQYGHQQYFNVTTPTTYWVRVMYKDGSCYRDTVGKTLP